MRFSWPFFICIPRISQFSIGINFAFFINDYLISSIYIKRNLFNFFMRKAIPSYLAKKLFFGQISLQFQL